MWEQGLEHWAGYAATSDGMKDDPEVSKVTQGGGQQQIITM